MMPKSHLIKIAVVNVVRMASVPVKLLTSLSTVNGLLLLAALISTACSVSDPEDENGTIGTGIILQGTVSDSLLAKQSVVDVISSDGKRSNIEINTNNAFSTTSLAGTGPWLLRVQVNANRSLFGIAFSDGTRNINAFSDVSLRRWFAQNSLQIDNSFDSTDAMVRLPSSIEYDESVSSITQLIDLVLESYAVTKMDIISTSYISNDQGIDKFLKRNTVVIENDLITFQVTDPATELQAETTSTIELASNSVDGGIPPTIPLGLRTLSGGMNDIVLIWEPSTDDVSVTGYVVLRDGVPVATTPYPQYIDTGLSNSQSYRYTIIAIDRAGNASDPSDDVLAVATTAQATGNDPLPAPTQLAKISASSSSIRLAWTPPEVPGVASYKVYRGVKDGPFTQLQHVTVPRATDTAVAVNETYCYQVTALDATGQESDRSEAICIDARNGELIDVNLIGLPGVPSGQPDDQWNIPDLNSLDCTSELSNESIPLGLTTINEGCYSVPQTLNVPDGATLQLGEGVVLKFGDAAKMSITGTLTVLGTRNNPVVFTGVNEIKGSWGGVEFAGTRNPANLLRGAVIQYGGGADVRGAISAAVSGLFSGPRFRMEDTLVRFNEGSALSLNVAQTRVDSFDRNLIYANDAVGFVVASTINTLAGSSQYIDNELNEMVVLPKLFIGLDIVIPNLGIPIRWHGLKIESGSLTILPGTDLELLSNRIVDVDGPVNIVGTAENPIILRGRSPELTGNWDGFKLYGPGNKVFDHVKINFAGGNRADTGAIDIDCSDNNQFQVQINNTEISNSASWGIFIRGNGCTPEIGDTVTYWKNALGNINVP